MILQEAMVLKDVTKQFTSHEGTVTMALKGVSLSALEGGITSVVGPTGCGKSTILRILSGLEEPDSGSALMAGLNPMELKARVGYLTQRHTLLPWMRARQNIALPLEIQGENECSRIVDGILDTLGLVEHQNLYPYELSGGMQQRAALGRLLASQAPYWLLDEPFSNLDENTQHRLQRLVLELVREHRLTVLLVTHSIDEAVFLSDRIVLMSASPGSVAEVLSPGMPHPRSRLSSDYGAIMENVRMGLQSVLEA